MFLSFRVQGMWGKETVVNIDDAMPAAVHDLILRSIGSVEQLEVLLLIRRSREVSFSRDELARKLRSSDASIRLTVQSLCLNGLAEQVDNGVYRYRSGSDDLEITLNRLEELYRTRRTTIIQTIYNKP